MSLERLNAEATYRCPSAIESCRRAGGPEQLRHRPSARRRAGLRRGRDQFPKSPSTAATTVQIVTCASIP